MFFVFLIFEYQTELMTITRIDSNTLLIDGIMFSKSDSGQYFTDSPESTQVHEELIFNYATEEREEGMKFFEESLAGIIICLN